MTSVSHVVFDRAFGKSAAYYLFLASLLGAIVTMIQTFAAVGLQVGLVIGNLVQLLVTAFLIWYSKQAENKGWIS